MFACVAAKNAKPRPITRDSYKQMRNVFALEQEHLKDMHGTLEKRRNVVFWKKGHIKLKKLVAGKIKIAFFQSGLSREPGAKCLLVDVQKQCFISPKEAAESYPKEANMFNLLKDPSLGQAEKIWCIELGDCVQVNNIVVLEPLNF